MGPGRQWSAYSITHQRKMVYGVFLAYLALLRLSQWKYQPDVLGSQPNTQLPKNRQHLVAERLVS